MHRRAFLLSAAGLAVTPNPDDILIPAAPEPAGLVSSGDPAFDAWRSAFIDRAAAAGLPRERVEAELDGLSPDVRITQLDQRQPELSRSVGSYMETTVSAVRVSRGQGFRVELDGPLETISVRTGVAPEIMLSVWAVESNFGQQQGGFDVVRSLATLAEDGRRREFAERQLIAALKIIVSGEAPRERLKGSWAGAMGQTQFTPEDYLAWAVDEDGDGQRDIWGSSLDALASTAQFLARKAAWRGGEGWAREVNLPEGFDYALAEAPFRPWADWAGLGVTPASGEPLSPAETGEGMGLILPSGWTGPAFLILPNHMAIRAYNNSTSYALAVGLLADRIAGRPGPLKAWPEETPLTLDDRKAAQEALNRLGYDAGTVDGVMGVRTRAAARMWQQSRSMPADGYLTYGLIQALKNQAGLGAATPDPLVDGSAAGEAGGT